MLQSGAGVDLVFQCNIVHLIPEEWSPQLVACNGSKSFYVMAFRCKQPKWREKPIETGTTTTGLSLAIYYIIYIPADFIYVTCCN